MVMETRFLNEISLLEKTSQADFEALSIQCQKYKTELADLYSFSAVKDDLEEKLQQFKLLVERKEMRHRP